MSHKKVAVALASVLASLACIVIAVLGISSKPAYQERTSDDYKVEHVADRIASKIDVSDSGTPTIADTGYRVRTRTLVADAGHVADDATIEDVYGGTDEQIVERILFQSESSSSVYDFGDEDEYVAYIDVTGDNAKTSHPQDVVFAYDTTQGEMIDSVRYDRENGLAYIPKDLFSSPRMSELDDNQFELQAQALVRYDNSQVKEAYSQDKSADVVGTNGATGEISSANTIPVEIASDAGRVSKMAQVPLLGNQLAVKLADPDAGADAVDVSNVSVSINDGALVLEGFEDEYALGSNAPSLSYDPATGDLNVHNVAPMAVMNIAVTMFSYVQPSMSGRAALAVAGEIYDPSDLTYSIGHWGQANCRGYDWAPGSAKSKGIRRHGPGSSVQNFLNITKNDLVDQTCAYAISIGGCPPAIGSGWSADGAMKWQANCVHASYPSGSNPPSGGYYKILDADWNNQTVTIAFIITCDAGGQEGGMALTFYAPRNGILEIYKKANANPALGSAWQLNVANATFGVYNSEAAARAKGSQGLVKRITTDARGVASAGFDDGTYWVSELSAPWPYIVTDQIVSFTAKPKSKDQRTIYEDSVPPIQIRKRILPSADSFSEGELARGSITIAHVKTSMASDGRSVITEIEAKQEISNLFVNNAATSVLGAPTSTAEGFNASTGLVPHMKKGDVIVLTQPVKNGQGWSNRDAHATVCSVSCDEQRLDMSLRLHSMSLEGTRYGVYSDASCTRKLGEAVLDASGVGYYGKHAGEWLSANTTYYVREVAGVNGYTVSSDIYPVTTSRNSQVSVNVVDSFSTLILTKRSGAGKQLTDKLPQFTLAGAKYGIFSDVSSAELHDASKVCRTLDGRAAIITTDRFGGATEVALGAGTYYVAELPSDVTRPWEYGKINDDFSEPNDIDAVIGEHEYDSKSNGKFLLDEKVYTVTLKPGGTTFEISDENIPVRIQLQKQSLRADLAHMSQFSLEGAVFGVYETEAAAKAAPTGNYKEDGFFLSHEGAVALLYGNKNGLTTVSWDLPLRDYYIKELRAPKNYKLLGESCWMVGMSKRNAEILHLSVDDFLSSGKYIDGVLTNVTTIKSNEPADVTVQVRKDASEVPDAMKNAGDAMSLAGAKFAIYRSFEDARSDENRIWFNTDDQPSGASDKTDLLVSNADGWTNKAVGLPAEECYWVREIEPPHVISDDPAQNSKNIKESMYVLDSEPVRASFAEPDEVAMIAYKDDAVKPVSIEVSKYAMSMDPQGRNLHVGEKDSNGVPYNDAYTDAAFAGAIFGLFETREAAEAARVTDDVNDVSVEQSAWDVGAVAVMTSDASGVCGSVDNLKWKSDGYYVRELKAPSSGCYRRNESILQVGCDRNTQDSEHIWCEIDEDGVRKHFEVDEIPNYYYVKIEKTSSDPNVLSNKQHYDLRGIHFGIYKTQAEAEAATHANPGKPLYNLYTKEVKHSDGSVHYEAISGLTGPGTFWAKELIDPSAPSNGFQALTSPIRVEAKLGGIPRYDATPIVPENSAPIVTPSTGQLQYKTAQDIDKELGITQRITAGKSRAALGTLNMPIGAVTDSQYAAIRSNNALSVNATSRATGRASTTNGVEQLYPTTYVPTAHVLRTDYTWYHRKWTHSGAIDSVYSTGTLGTSSNMQNSFGVFGDDVGVSFFTDEWWVANDGSTCHQWYIWYVPVIESGYSLVGWSVNGSYFTQWIDINGGTATISPVINANQYTVSFNANGGSGASPAKTATYNAAMPSVSVPTRTGYIFQGYYDAASGGTKYYNANGTSARAYDKLGNATLYAHWTPITYTVKYMATDPNAALTPGMSGASTTTTETYDKEGTLKSGIYHKFGYVSKAWKYTADDGSVKILTPGTSKLLNLTAVNGKTVTLTAVWDLNEYWVKFNDGLSAQWGPAPVVEKGTNPDTGTPWSLGYQQKLYYDDWANDGIASDSLTKVRYSHPHFAFKYWIDGTGQKYNDMQSVQNLAAPNQVKNLTGVWYPSFDYGVDCEANVIMNQPIGGITVQKVVKTSGFEPSNLTDLSGIVFELFSDANCTQSVATATTDAKGVAVFSNVKTNTAYYVKEKQIPDSLSSVMQMSNEAKQVRSGGSASYEFVNECKQLSIALTKAPSRRAVDSISSAILSNLPPAGAKFAVYATERDARNDANRIRFYDENGHVTTVATATKIVEEDGVKCATTTLSGLPSQNLWIVELAAPDNGGHEYVLSKDPIYVSKDAAEITNGTAMVPIRVENDMPPVPSTKVGKRVSPEDMAKLPEILRDDAQALCDGITYALYMDRAAAAARSDDHVQLFEISDGHATLQNLPHGTYYLIEWALPESAGAAGISRSDKVVTMEVSAGDAELSAELLDGMVTKKMHVKKIDAETHEPIRGVVFDIYTDETKQELLCSTSQTDAQGIAASNNDLILGRSYFVQERYESLPGDYNGNAVGSDETWSGWIELSLSSDIEDAFVVENEKNDEKGSIEVRKTSNTGASTTGAIFSVYDASGALYADMETIDGVARIDGVPVGNYTVKETVALPLHALTGDGSAAETFQGAVLPDSCWYVNDGNAVENYQGYVKVHKQSSAPEMTDALTEVYSLAGAAYSLYPIEDGRASATPLPVVMTTDENGNSEPVAVPIGPYKVIETTEPANFETPAEQREFFIDVTLDATDPDHAVVVESEDNPFVEPLANLLVEKRSAETYEASDGAPQGATSMAKTKFAIEYAPVQAGSYQEAIAVEKTRKWVIETDIDGRAIFAENSIIEAESDELFRDSQGNAALPVGTIVVRETVPPTGYTLGKAPTTAYRFSGDSGKFEELFEDTDDIREWPSSPIFTAANDIYRTDISFHKTDAFDANKVMGHIPFSLSLLDGKGNVIERHLIATDENGNFSSTVGSIESVNENDRWIPGDVISGCVDATFEPSDSRVWFSGSSTQVTPSSGKGALIYGDYELREYYKDDTAHYQPLEPIRFSVRGDNDQSWIEIDGKKILDGDLTTAIGDIENHSIHVTSTTMLDSVTKTHAAGDGNLLANETIRYADATVGERYVFETYAYDVDTKEPIIKTFEDVDGEVVDVQAGGAYVLEAEYAEGEVRIDVSFEGYNIAKRKIGLVTKVYHNGYLSDTHNKDLTDDEESVSFSELRTTATDADTTQHVGLSDGHVRITDIVEYSNLVPECEYTVRGILMDKASGGALRDAHGAEILAEKTFVAHERDGQVVLDFEFDMPSNTAFSAVAFEEVYANGAVCASHKDIDDEEQTVEYPSVETVALDSKTGLAQGRAEDGRISVIDTVLFENLTPHRQYELRGMLYVLDADGNKSPIEGSFASYTFSPDQASGTQHVLLAADAETVRGHRVLVGEEIWSDGKIVAQHDDVAFNDQIVSYPSIATTATDVASGLHVGNGESARQLSDKVHLEGLKAGESYRIDGIVMARGEDGAAAPTQVTATKTFTAQSDIEDHILIFDLPADFPERDAVVFEKLLSADGAHVLTTHEDANDEGQTVHYPEIGTLALHPGGTHVGSNIDNIVVDTVFYKNLVPGYEYKVVGMLADRETGEFVSNAQGNGPVVSSVMFSPEESDGEIDVPFDLNGIDVSGRTLVVFERLLVMTDSVDGETTLIATHCDIDSGDQSIFYPHVRTSARDANTGTHVGSSLSEAKIIDVVEYANLVEGYEYDIVGTLIDKETGTPVLVDDAPVQTRTRFAADHASGSIELAFSPVPADIARGKTIVVYEELLLSNIEMASHKDIADAEQSVSYPVISTVAEDSKTHLHEGNAGAIENDRTIVTIIDHVSYHGLVSGSEYTIVGKLMDKASGKVMAENKQAFIADATDGSVEIAFDLDADTVHGKTLVAFEKLYDEQGIEIANHEDIDDEEQTVSYPKIGTEAIDKRSQTHAGSIESIAIIDEVTYEGLLEGHEYVLVGTLMDKQTGEPLIGTDGQPVTSQTSFTAEVGGAGSAQVEFASEIAGAELLAGKTLVAFERLEEAGDNEHRILASHEDIDDEEQSVYYPKITRTLARADDGSKMLAYSQTALMSDTVTYENVVPGVEYILDGAMMDKRQGETLVASGKSAVSQARFTPTSTSGEATVMFELDTTMTEISDVVVFENMTVNGAVVGEHKDYNSEDQSIHGVADDLVETGETISDTSDSTWWLLMMASGVLMSFGLILLMRSAQRQDHIRE